MELAYQILLSAWVFFFPSFPPFFPSFLPPFFFPLSFVFCGFFFWVVAVVEDVTKLFQVVSNHMETFKYPGQAPGEDGGGAGSVCPPLWGTCSTFKENKELLFLVPLR